jgi:hypothetical protein
VVLSLVFGALTLGAACGGGDDDDDSGSNGNGDDAAATEDTGGDDGGDDGADSGDDSGDDGDSGGGGSVDEDDLEAFADELEPPGADETVRFSASDGVIVSWETDESLDDLKDFYEGKFEDMDLNIQGTVTSGETTTWVIGNEDGSGIQGGVVIAPGSSKTSLVQVTVGPGS